MTSARQTDAEWMRSVAAKEAENARKDAIRRLASVAEEVQRMLRQCESGAGYDTGGDHAARNHVGELAAACVAYAKWRAFAAVKDY